MSVSSLRLIAVGAALGIASGVAVSVQGAPITVAGYTYDLSQADPGTGVFTTFHSDPAAQDSGNTKLTDGELGSEVLIVDPGGSSVFGNGTWVGFVNDGFGGAPQPRINIDLGGEFTVESVEVTYLVEDPTFIFAPQPVPVDPLDPGLGNLFEALTVSTSTNGVDYTEAAFTNDFTPIFGPGGDFGSGVRERRSVLLNLSNTLATHVSVEIHTPFSFIFLGEVIVSGTSASLEGDLNGDGFVGVDDLNIVLVNWNQNVTPGDLLAGDPTGEGFVGVDDLNIVLVNWNAGTPPGAASVPEPGSATLIAFGALGTLAARRRRHTEAM